MQRLDERQRSAPHPDPASDRPVRYSLRQLRTTLLDTQKRLTKEHGGFARYQVLRRVFTLVASAEANRRMLVQAPRSYPRGRQYDNLALLIGRGLICAEGADWRRQRKLVQPVFDKALMARVVEITASVHRATGGRAGTRPGSAVSRWTCSRTCRTWPCG